MIRLILISILFCITGVLHAQIIQVDTSKSVYPSLLEITHGHVLSELGHNKKEAPFASELSLFQPSLGHTAFFCKIEDKFKKSSKIPIKMRLGDVEYVDKIEGKGIQTHIPD